MKSYRHTIKSFLYKSQAAKAISILYIFCFIIQVSINMNSDLNDALYTYPFIDPVSLLLIMQAILATLIASRYGHLFWISKPSNKPIDERQLFQRRKIFETAYVLAVIFMLVFTVSLYSANPEFAYPGSVFIGLAILLYSFPSLIATWREEPI